MYEAHWNLNRKPFSYRVNAEELFRSGTLQNAILRLRYCFDNNAGAALLLGASGVGKSSLLHLIRAEYSELQPFVHIAFPTLTSLELLRSVAADLPECDIPQTADADSLLLAIRAAIRKQSDAGHHAVIAFDEAHLLTQDALNQAVLPLLNIVDTNPELRLTIILSGQPVLASHVSRNAQLRERIAVTATLESFTDTETQHYVHSRLEAAGAQQQIFTDDAIEALVGLSGGVPRRLNRLCDMALLVCYADQVTEVTATEVESLAVEILPAAA